MRNPFGGLKKVNYLVNGKETNMTKKLKKEKARDALRSKIIDCLKPNNSKREEEKENEREKEDSFGSKMECVREIKRGRVERKR